MGQSIKQFVAKHEITASIEAAEGNPHMSDMPAGSAHYLVTLKRGKESMQVPYSHGPAICREPDAASVLGTLQLDAVSVINAPTLDQFGAELGYFPIEDVAAFERLEASFEACTDLEHELRGMLGEELMEELLYETDSD